MHIMYSSNECIELQIVWSRLRFALPPPFATSQDATQPSSSWLSMPRALETHANPPLELPRTRLRPRKAGPRNVQAQAPPQKPLTVAEQERLLRISLPTELWKEVIRHAVSVEHEFETCGFDGKNYTFEHSELYQAEWYQALQTRLSLVLVCKTWNNLASEYLYRSILISNACSAREFVRLVLRLVNNGMIKYVQRVSVCPFHGSNPPKSSLLNAMAQFPDLRILEIRNHDLFRPGANQTHITTLRAALKGWSAFEALAFLPHLQHLQFSFHNEQSILSRVKLSKLKTLHVEFHPDSHLFYEWLDLPALHTLILSHLYARFQLPLIQHFLPHIRALGFGLSMAQLPPNNISAPHLKSFICRQPFGANWKNLSRVAPLKSIEEVHLSLEEAVLYRLLARRPFYNLDYHISSILVNMEDESVMQKLRNVYTDLTPNTLRIMKPEVKERLREWLTIMKKREVMVMTYIKTSKYTGHRYYSLEEAWDAEPHWEFWAPTSTLDEMRKWDLLAEATGRNNMTWKVSKDGSECQWFNGA